MAETAPQSGLSRGGKEERDKRVRSQARKKAGGKGERALPGLAILCGKWWELARYKNKNKEWVS